MMVEVMTMKITVAVDSVSVGRGEHWEEEAETLIILIIRIIIMIIIMMMIVMMIVMTDSGINDENYDNC